MIFFFFSDLDSSFYSKVRLPPSGRSSVLSNQHESSSHQNLTPGDFKSVMSLNFSRSSSTNSLKNLQDTSPGCYYFNKGQTPRDMSYNVGGGRRSKSKSYSSSEESGIEDKSSLTDFSMTSSKTSVTTPLSPVHEVKESPNKSLDIEAGRKGQKARRRAPIPFQMPSN